MIALSTRAGIDGHIVDLTYGERGESEDYWKRTPDGSEEEVKAIRRTEAEEAAAVLGASIEFLDWDDYPLEIGRPRLEQLARIILMQRPNAIATHWHADPYNVDHEITADAVSRAMTVAAAPGFAAPESPLLVPPLFAFEPTLPRDDDTGFRPTHYVVIDDIFDVKMQALSCLRSQSRLSGMYTQWAEYRGAQARQWSGRPVRYAEAYVRRSAVVTKDLLLEEKPFT